MLKRNNSYVLMVISEMGLEMLLKKLGIFEDKEGFFIINKILENLIKYEGCKRVFIRGVFFGGGFISDLEKNYYMEFVINNEEFVDFLKEFINFLGFNSKIVVRKNNYVVYIKESE